LNDHNWPFVYIEWKTESVFLTREEAEAFGKAREYRWDKWKVYCVPCDGELATILKNYEPTQLVAQPLRLPCDGRKFLPVQSARRPAAKCLGCGYCFLQKDWFAICKCPKCKSENLILGTATVSTAESKEANLDRAD
jgi:predicted nucleic-acid-binding Zn-ribbon protein